MFLSPHARSQSEIEIGRDYEPALTYSPGSRGASPPAAPAATDPDSGTSSPAQYAFRRQSREPSGNLNSPHPSYYSISDLPAPSPLPEPTYRYSTTGEITPTPPSRRPSVRTLNSGADPASPPLPGSANLQVPTRRPSKRQPIVDGTYEMRVRSPPRYGRPPQSPPLGSPLGSPRESDLRRSASEMSHNSFATASEGDYLSDTSPPRPTHSESRTEGAAAAPMPSAFNRHLGLSELESTVNHDSRASQLTTDSQLSWSGPHAV